VLGDGEVDEVLVVAHERVDVAVGVGERTLLDLLEVHVDEFYLLFVFLLHADVELLDLLEVVPLRDVLQI